MNFICSIFLLIKLSFLLASTTIDVFMPDVSPTTKDTYLCYKYELDDQNPIFITEFQPKANKEIAHHILLFGCEIADEELVWNCGEMSKTTGQNTIYKHAPVCKGGKQSIIYAWAMDAPKLILPEDVAFKVGGDSRIKYLILQVHYLNVENFIRGEKDKSGVALTVQDKPLNYVAGVYLLETGGFIKKNSKEYFEAACQINENVEMYPFAFRVHAHKLGLVNSGYVIKNDFSQQVWTEIGRRSPQLPQMFYPVTNKITVKKGDILAARCTMKNDMNHKVYIGSTGDDEMCNFYIMYYTKDQVLQENLCITRGPPGWYFESFLTSNGLKLDTSLIPQDISDIPEDQLEELHAQKENKMNHNHLIEKMEKDDELNKSNKRIYNYKQIRNQKEKPNEFFFKNILNQYLNGKYN